MKEPIQKRGLKTTLSWALATAWRDARGAKGKAVFNALGMALGIAALVAMGSFGADLDRAVDDQARSMVGADLLITSRRAFNEDVASFLAQIPATRSAPPSFECVPGAYVHVLVFEVGVPGGLLGLKWTKFSVAVPGFRAPGTIPQPL